MIAPVGIPTTFFDREGRSRPRDASSPAEDGGRISRCGSIEYKCSAWGETTTTWDWDIRRQCHRITGVVRCLDGIMVISL